MQEAIDEIMEELRYFERLIEEAETELKKKDLGEDLVLQGKYKSWLIGYRDTLRELYNVCEIIQKRSTGHSNIRFMDVYRLRQDAWELLRAIYLKLS